MDFTFTLQLELERVEILIYKTLFILLSHFGLPIILKKQKKK